MSRFTKRRRNAAAALVLAGLAAGFPSGAAAQLPPPVESEPIPFDPAIVLSVCANADFTGTNGPNVIIGTPGPDVIDARGGADTIRGRGGNDVICAGGGNDDDILRGGLDDDLLLGESGIDALFGGPGVETTCDPGTDVGDTAVNC